MIAVPAMAAAPQRKTDPPRILVVLDEGERDLFFFGPLRERLARLVPESEWLSPDADGSNLADALLKVRPQVLLGGWSLPEIGEDVLDECPELDYFCFVAGTVRGRMPRAFWERGGTATNWGNTISHTIAECALTLVLACLRQVSRFHQEMHLDRSWRAESDTPPRSLFNRRVGIHGFGHIARELIKLLAPFRVEIEAWSDPVPAAVFARTEVRRARSLVGLFAANEIVIDVEALTPATQGSVNEEAINALKPGSVFVNVGRGKVVDEAALARRAVKGDISVGLDVFENEPLPSDSPLRGLPNAVLFPHTGGPTEDHYPLCAKAALDNLDAYLAGRPLINPFSLEMFDRAT